MAEAAEQLTVSSSNDTQADVETVAQGGEARRESEFVSQELPGISRESNSGSPPRAVRATTFEHPRSSRQHMIEALDEAEAELAGESAKQVATEPSGEEATAAQEPDAEIMRAVREAAVQDAVAHARQNYYAQQTQAHLAPVQIELNELREKALVPFQARMADLTAGLDLRGVPNIPISDAVRDVLITLSGGPEATIYLAQHPEEARQLSTLPESIAVAKVAALTARLDPSTKRGVSKAPAPIRPVTGSPTSSAIPADELPYQEYKRRREQEIRARRR
jgi:hypothetical protein